MKVTETSVSYSKKVQIERFEPVEISSAVTATLEEGEDPETARDELYADLREEVDTRMLDVILEKKLNEEDE